MITGASSGFGAATARAFGVLGARLLLGARRLARLEEVASQAKEAGAAEVHVHVLDVSQTASVESFMSGQKPKPASRPPKEEVYSS
jgi:NADP-dependent 3-hydroxy acid dehydrogenase YdfG